MSDQNLGQSTVDRQIVRPNFLTVAKHFIFSKMLDYFAETFAKYNTHLLPRNLSLSTESYLYTENISTQVVVNSGVTSSQGV